MSKALLALFIFAAIAVGAILVLVVGGLTVENDGVENDSLPPLHGRRRRTGRGQS